YGKDRERFSSILVPSRVCLGARPRGGALAHIAPFLFRYWCEIGRSLMSGPRCDRMLAGTALALLLAAPFGVAAQEAAKSPAIASPATEASPPPAIPAGELPMASINSDLAAPAAPAAVTEETAAPDPLASLDPADRPGRG